MGFDAGEESLATLVIEDFEDEVIPSLSEDVDYVFMTDVDMSGARSTTIRYYPGEAGQVMTLQLNRVPFWCLEWR